MNDTDCRILRRPAATDDSQRSAAAGAGLITLPVHRDGSGTISGSANGKRGTSLSSSSRQRGRSVPAGANFVKSVPPYAAAARTKGRVPAPSGCRSNGDGLFVGNGSNVHGSVVGREKSRGDDGGMLAAGLENGIVWDRGSAEGGIDSGPTLCSSVSTLSREAF